MECHWDDENLDLGEFGLAAVAARLAAVSENFGSMSCRQANFQEMTEVPFLNLPSLAWFYIA